MLTVLLSITAVSSLAPSLLLWLWWWRVSSTTDSTERLQLATVLSAEMAVKLGTIIKGMVERSLSGRSLRGISVVGSPASWSFFLFDGTAATSGRGILIFWAMPVLTGSTTDGRLGFVPLISSSLMIVVAVGEAGTGTNVGEDMEDWKGSCCRDGEAGGIV